MSWPNRGRWLLVATGVLSACAGRMPHTAVDLSATVTIDNEEQYDLVRADYDALPLDNSRRAHARAALEAWALGEVQRELGAKRADSAFEILKSRVLPLWDARDLEKAPHDAPLLAVAQEIERRFERRGARVEVLTGLAMQITLAPDDVAPRQRWALVLGWMRDGLLSTPGSAACEEPSCAHMVELLESVVQDWPSSFAVEQLAEVYGERQQAAGHILRHGLSSELAEILTARPSATTGYDLARLYLRVSRPAEALTAMEKLTGQPGDDPPLRKALARYLAKNARPMDAITVAAAFAREPVDRPVALRICQDAATRFPNAIEPELCIGEVAMQRQEIALALAAFERALAIDPNKHDIWEAIARLHQGRLVQLVSDERVSDLQAELHRVEKLHAEAQRRFPQKPLHTSVASALYEVGRGYYNAGLIDEAVRYFTRSMSLEPNVAPAERLAVIALKRGHAQEALDLLARADALLERTQRDDLYWRAKLARTTGDARELAAEHSAAEAAWQRAATLFGKLCATANNLSPDDLAEAELEHAKARYLIGDRDAAMSAFHRAIDVAPDRGATYADVLAFLAPRGERDEALDAYHRALGRPEISEYLKVYCTLWVLYLDRLEHAPEDPLAHAFLGGVDGSKWCHELARWATGRETESELLAHAKNPRNRAEALFYEAMSKLSRGELAEAQALWRRVIGTEMMADFEFDMASFYLRHGGLGKPTVTKSKHGTPVPDGSI